MWSYATCTCLSSYASGLSSTTVEVTFGGIGVGSFSSEGARTLRSRMLNTVLKETRSSSLDSATASPTLQFKPHLSIHQSAKLATIKLRERH